MTEAAAERRLYGDLAWAFPIISPLEDYIEETELFVKAIRSSSEIPVRSLLHLGCGGGHNDFVFKRHFAVTGLDLSEPMLDLARRLNPEATYVVADMRAADLGKRFDSVAAIDSLEYMTTPGDLRAAFATAHVHLHPSGVFFFLVEQTREAFRQNRTLASVHRMGALEIAFIENIFDPDPSDDTFESTFVYLVRRAGVQDVHIDRHLCGIFSEDGIGKLAEEAGFRVTRLTFSPPGSAIAHSGLTGQEKFPMFVCRKPS